MLPEGLGGKPPGVSGLWRERRRGVSEEYGHRSTPCMRAMNV